MWKCKLLSLVFRQSNHVSESQYSPVLPMDTLWMFKVATRIESIQKKILWRGSEERNPSSRGEAYNFQLSLHTKPHISLFVSVLAMGRFLLSSILAICLLGLARSDTASDLKECQDVLLGLSTCFPYVLGQAKTPTTDCCSGLKQVLVKSTKCLCVLIKDRNDPSLAKINATLALKLPSTCGTSFNITNCIGNITNQSSGGGSTAANSWKRGRGKEWWARDMVVGVWIWCFVWLSIMCS